MASQAVAVKEAQPARANATDCEFCNRVRNSLAKWLALSQFGFPFAISPASTSVDRFRSLARGTRFVGKNKILRPLANIAMTFGWPVGAFLTARRTIARMRKRGQTPHGLRVQLDMYWLALRYNIPPLEYALYRFNQAERREDMHQYVYWNDLPGLAALTARTGADNRDVQDKDRFADICAAKNLPHVQTLAVFDAGRQIYPATPFVPDCAALWVKPLRVKDGAEGDKWIRDGDCYRNRRGKHVPAAKLADEFRAQDCLVQPYAENHPAIAPLTNGALAVLRIVTGMNERAEAEFIASFAALPHGKHQSSVGGIICSIGRETGRIGRALKPVEDEVTHHPNTGAPIAGFTLPFWHESIELVQRAHATAFPRFAFLGWDVALTSEGPLLLETNSGWGALFHQMLDGPIGHTAFSRLVRQYV